MLRSAFLKVSTSWQYERNPRELFYAPLHHGGSGVKSRVPANKTGPPGRCQHAIQPKNMDCRCPSSENKHFWAVHSRRIPWNHSTPLCCIRTGVQMVCILQSLISDRLILTIANQEALQGKAQIISKDHLRMTSRTSAVAILFTLHVRHLEPLRPALSEDFYARRITLQPISDLCGIAFAKILQLWLC